MKKFFLPFLFLFSLLGLFTACEVEVGMGEALDLEAPVCTVTSPQTLSNVHKSFRMAGTCSDNIGVTAVEITDKSTGQLYANATINGNTWYVDLNLEEGERTLVVTAKDKACNQSAKSYRTCIYLVDETAPEGLSWYVDRGNNVQTPLKSRKELRTMDYDDFTNIDVPQNESFSVHGHFYDAFSIRTIKLELFEVPASEVETAPADWNQDIIDDKLGTDPYNISHLVVSKEIAAATLDTSKSIYSPEFDFTDSDLAGLTTGKHYLKLRYTSIDQHGNTSSDVVLPYMIWWPESDEPRVQLSGITNGSMRVNIGSAIPIHFFDDDLLTDVRAAIVPSSFSRTESEIKSNPGLVTWDLVKNSSDLALKRDDAVQINAPNTPQQMKLVTYAVDDHGKKKVRICDVEVTDASKPLLFIESPDENVVPPIEQGTSSFKIKGYSLDTTGSSRVVIAYVPELSGDVAVEKGKNLCKGTAIPQEGQFVETYNLGTKIDDGGWKKQTFEFTFDLLTKFRNGDISYARENKFFEMLLVDEDNNEVWKSFQLTGDTTPPDITVASPASNMAVYDYSDKGPANLEIKYKASKSSGLGVDPSKYKVSVTWEEGNVVEYTPGNGLTVDADGYAVVNIPRSEIASKKDLNNQPTIVFEAADVLGNPATARYNVVLSPLPQLDEIISGNMNGTFKKGDVINFHAVFTDAVKVTVDEAHPDKVPQLKLKFNPSDTEPKLANYNGTGNRTTTLVFSYTVQENDTSDLVKIFGTETADHRYENVIKLPDQTGITEIAIKTALTGEGDAYIDILASKCLAGKEFKIDGVLPTITGISITPEDLYDAASNPDGIRVNADGNYYLKANEVIKAVVTFSENVNIKGSPVLKLFCGNDSSKSPVEFALQNISGNTITFTHKIAAADPQGTIYFNNASSFAKDTTGVNAGYVSKITDTAGNPLKLEANSYVDKGIVIDTGVPAAVAINIAGGTETTYNIAQALKLTGESGAKVEFSPNGGISWYEYPSNTDPQAGISLTSGGFTIGEAFTPVSGGEYNLKTRQTDKAGNVSPENGPVHFTINDTFPAINGIAIQKSDGHYPAGDKVKFVVSYADVIKATDATSAVLSFTIGTSQPRTVNVKPTSASGSSKLEFEYTVSGTAGAEDEGDGVKVTRITYSTVSGKRPVDKYGNSPSADVTISSYSGVYQVANRPYISLDGKAPVISTYSPVSGSISASNNNVIKLTFSENVYKESGMITLRRKGDWRIPPVLTETEFNSVYNELTLAADKALLMKTETGGTPVQSIYTGQPVGPYRRITHGLAGGDGSSTVPDTSTKFVLDFNVGIETGTRKLSDGTSVSVDDIRAVFERAGYHKQELEVTDTAVVINNNVVTITFPEALVDGREWEVVIEPGAFRDETGNLFEGLGSITPAKSTNTVAKAANREVASTPYSFWTGKVAKPWVRVDRYSHGYAAVEPEVNGTGTSATYKTVKIITSYGTKHDSTAVNAANTKPAGYARVRIDCETPGATIMYNWGGKVTNTANPEGDSSVLWTDSTSLTDTSLSTINANKTYNGYFVVGDGESYTARRDFVKAYATKDHFTNSADGYEGVFKTVVTMNCNNSQNFTKIEGGTAAGGMPSINGFPVRDAEEKKGHDKGCYRISEKQYVWQTYEIISTWWILPYNGNYTSTYYRAGYGYANHIYHPGFYSQSSAASDESKYHLYNEISENDVK